MNELKNCPNCQTELKSGLMSSVKLLTKKATGLINEYGEKKSDGFCTKCGKGIYEEAKTKLEAEKNKLALYLKNKISNIPVISAHTPLNWDYQVLEMVTGQSTTGTGVITEFTSSFSDLFGAQSNRHNQKLKSGENMCFAQLRIQALNLGGNAVISTDIDYSEIGTVKGMLMVCMAGTAIKLNNTEVIKKEKAEIIDKLSYANNRLKELQKFE
ncbi:MAG: heavy metal-binding domain-containing protein [Flavobacteriaceae bacterium]|nr:heavy metal-binding domain-containing protein [Flavobacteriaceae bacterium]